MSSIYEYRSKGETPASYAKQLVTYIKDPAKVRSLVKYEFGEAPTIETIRRYMPTEVDAGQEIEISEARIKYLRSLIAELPDPQRFAESLPAELAAALALAWRASDPQNCGCWRVADEYARPLQAVGVVASGGPWLSNFGNSVRKAVMEWM